MLGAHQRSCGQWTSRPGVGITAAHLRASSRSPRLSCRASAPSAAPGPLGDELRGVSIVSIPGKGRGVVASEALSPGATLIAARPLALLEKPHGVSKTQNQISISDAGLVQHLVQSAPKFGPQQQQALEALFFGNTYDTKSGGSVSSTPSQPLSAEHLAAVVKYNATGMPSTDVLLSHVTGTPRRAYIGLWPAHAGVNSSCCPNASTLLEGDIMYVRACVPIPVQSEVCITYAGALGLAPMAVRRSLLQRNHGFLCTCPRCMLEQQLPPQIGQLWSDVFGVVVQQLQPQLTAAAAAAAVAQKQGVSSVGATSVAAGKAPPAPSAIQVFEQLQQLEGVVQQVLQQLQATPQEVLWLEASLYVLYENLAKAALQAAQQVAARQGQQSAHYQQQHLVYLSKCLGLVGVANPGSDQHVQMAARLVSAVQGHDAGAEVASVGLQAACQRLDRALNARYGYDIEEIQRKALREAAVDLLGR